jgi:predicted nucleic acid-binding protein
MRLRYKGRSEMHGDRYLLDTNAIVALLQGHKELLALTASAQWFGV